MTCFKFILSGLSFLKSEALRVLDLIQSLLLSLQGQMEDLGAEFHTNASEGSVSLHPSPSRYGWNPGQALATF